MTPRTLTLAAVTAGALLAPASANAWSDKPKPPAPCPKTSGSKCPTPTPTPDPPPPVTIVERYGCDGLLIAIGLPAPLCPGAPVPVPTPAPSCTSRRTLTIRILENRHQHLRTATGTFGHGNLTATRRASDGRLVMTLDFRGMIGPDLVVVKLHGVKTDGSEIDGRRVYQLCKVKDDVGVNFQKARL